MPEPTSFQVVTGDPASPYVIDVPHSSTRIPHDVRTQLVLDDDALAKELHLMTDGRTKERARVHESPVQRPPGSITIVGTLVSRAKSVVYATANPLDLSCCAHC